MTIAFLATVALRTLPAQTLGSAGSRIRLELAGQDRPPVVGTLLGTRGDTVFVRDGTDAASTVAVPLSGVRRVKVSEGRHGHVLAGLGLGLLIGAAAGAVIGGTTTSNTCQTCGFGGSDKALGAVAGVVVGGVGGLVLGGITGVLVRTDRWVTVPAANLAPRLTFDPRSGAVGVRFSLAWR